MVFGLGTWYTDMHLWFAYPYMYCTMTILLVSKVLPWDTKFKGRECGWG